MFLATSSCTVEKTGINAEITNEKIRLFLSMLLLTGYHKLPDHKIYCNVTTILLCEQGLIQRLVMRWSVLESLQLCDIEQLDK